MTKAALQRCMPVEQYDDMNKSQVVHTKRKMHENSKSHEFSYGWFCAVIKLIGKSVL